MEEYILEERGIAYRKNAFSAGRPTLLFVHGLSGSSSAWFPYEAALGSDYNLLTLDLRGHGKSRKYTAYSAYRIEEMAEDLAALLEHVQVPTCTLVSHSFGTLVALEFCLAHPEKISRALFLSPTAFLQQTPWYLLNRTLLPLVIALLRLLPFRPPSGGRTDYAPFMHTGDWNIGRIREDLQNTTLRIYLYCLDHAYGKNYNPLWKEVRVPTLIVHGMKDSIVPVENAERLHAALPGSRLALLPGANHILVLNNVSQVLTYIRHPEKGE